MLVTTAFLENKAWELKKKEGVGTPHEMLHVVF